MKFFLPSLRNLSVLVLVICFASCEPEQKEKTTKRTVFKYNQASGLTSLDPAFAKDQANIWPVNQIYNGLVQLDEKLNVQETMLSIKN